MPKKPASLSINSDLLRQAREFKINLSRGCNEGLEARVREQWLAENRAALESYNRYVERRGVFSGGLRRF